MKDIRFHQSPGTVYRCEVVEVEAVVVDIRTRGTRRFGVGNYNTAFGSIQLQIDQDGWNTFSTRSSFSKGIGGIAIDN